jgi:hypothetical protein
MNKIIFAITCILFLQLSFAQETKNIVYDAKAEIRTVQSFNGIEVGNAINVYIAQGTSNAVAISVEGDSNDKIKTEVINGILKISVANGYWNKWNWSNNIKMKAYITVKTLEKLVIHGASKATFTDKIISTNLNITVSGASILKGDINTENLHLDLSGASNASLGGYTSNLIVNASGASSLKAYNLNTVSCAANASGASDIKITVTKEFTKIEASGASSIRYKGDAGLKNLESSGASSVKKEMR